MRRLIEEGLSAAEAARVALSTTAPSAVEPEATGPEMQRVAAALEEALDRFDEVDAQTALDRLLGGFSLPTALRDVLLPYLRRLGDRWSEGSATVAQEHFASTLIRGRLLGLARGWGDGRGPLAVLACPPGELHDLALIMFGIVLARLGWRIAYLGPDTPIETLTDAARRLGPRLVVLAATEPLSADRDRLRELARATPLVLAGPGATDGDADALGVPRLYDDPVSAAGAVDSRRWSSDVSA
jgi:methanogenic corrinoid protein MtbC1